MNDFLVFMLITAVKGVSIFLSMPIVYSRRAQGRWAVGLNAAAIGILVFLLADIFGDAAAILYPGGYIADPAYALVFGAAFVLAFVTLYLVDNLPRRGAAAASGPTVTAFIIALGIGFQNLTEGLVFGVNWVQGSLGILGVVFVGFFLQNISEGFPIAAPFLGTKERRNLSLMGGLFLIGGLPTLLGGAIGNFWSSDLFILIFDALAIGAIAYVILPMLRVAFRPLETRELSRRRDRLVYIGVLVGFVIGFAVNAI